MDRSAIGSAPAPVLDYAAPATRPSAWQLLKWGLWLSVFAPVAAYLAYGLTLLAKGVLLPPRIWTYDPEGFALGTCFLLALAGIVTVLWLCRPRLKPAHHPPPQRTGDAGG